MPWRETCQMDQRVAFVSEALLGKSTMTELCAHYEISRKTGYKWLSRYRSEGAAGLEDRSRAPKRHGRAMALEVAEAILQLRRERPSWGPRKLRAYLEAHAPDRAWPSASSMGDLLRAHGLSASRRRSARRPGPLSAPFAEVSAANTVWSVDFKGWFRTGDGVRCDPLTVSDAYSRYVLLCEIVEPKSDPVERAMRALFERCGVPQVLRMDNGPPFASGGPGGLTALSLSWLKAGIGLERIAPGHPEQNGRHERFHLTLKQETSCPPAASRAEQQRRFDRFCHSYNSERPHEALGQKPPAAFWQPSPRRYPRHLLEPWYDADFAVRKVRSSGEIKWAGRSFFISETLAGEQVGIGETIDGEWLVRYAKIDLGILDLKRKRLIRFFPPRSGRKEATGPQKLLPIYPV